MTFTLFLLVPALVVAIDTAVLVLARRTATRPQRLAFWSALASLCLVPVCLLSAFKLAANFLHGDTATGIVFVGSASGVAIGTLLAIATVFVMAGIGDSGLGIGKSR